MKNVFKIFTENSPRTLIVHIIIVLAIGVAIIFAFFYMYLPEATNHGETITVPNLRGLSVQEAQELLAEREMRFEISDSVYSVNYPPLAVISHYPDSSTKVKLDRKIYLTISKEVPPSMPLPEIIGGQIKNVQMILENMGLGIGEVEYIPNVATNRVLKIRINGKEFEENDSLLVGMEVEKGQEIDLVVGNGLGNDQVNIPDVVGMTLEEAEQFLIGYGLGAGHIEYVDTLGVELGTVLQQQPEPGMGRVMKVGSIIDLWVAGFFPENGIAPSEQPLGNREQ